jgi:2-(1,2-epoxy-1,2-dihydrophenyl)acetyl-CoA isomerase
VSAISGSVSWSLDADGVATVRMGRPPNNPLDIDVVRCLVSIFAQLDSDPAARSVVLCAEGKHFCAGVDFVSGPGGAPDPGALYSAALPLFTSALPVVAAINGGAVGGGLGLALCADFRVVSPTSWLSANFASLGLHQGFGISETLPVVVGAQRALELLYTGRRLTGAQAFEIGLADRITDDDEGLHSAALQLAREIAAAAPLAVRAIRRTMRGPLSARVGAAMEVEQREQLRLLPTDDFAEGVRASRERRRPRFAGR